MSEQVKAQIGSASINTDTDKLADLARRVVSDEDFRKAFQSDPRKALGDAGINLPDEASARSAGKALEDFLEGGQNPLSGVVSGDPSLHTGSGSDPQAVGPAVVVVAAAAAAVASTSATVVMPSGGAGSVPTSLPEGYVKPKIF